jgi:hypothetical protein
MAFSENWIRLLYQSERLNIASVEKYNEYGYPNPHYNELHVDENAWQNSPFYRDGLEYVDGMTWEYASILSKFKDVENHRMRIAEAGSKYPVVSFLGGIAGSIPDPLNFVPFTSTLQKINMGRKFYLMANILTKRQARVGALKMMEYLGKSIVEGTEAGLTVALEQPFVYSMKKDLQEHFDLRMAAMNVAFATGFATFLGTFGRSLSHAIEAGKFDIATRMLRKAVADNAEGKPIDVGGEYAVIKDALPDEVRVPEPIPDRAPRPEAPEVPSAKVAKMVEEGQKISDEFDAQKDAGVDPIESVDTTTLERPEPIPEAQAVDRVFSRPGKGTEELFVSLPMREIEARTKFGAESIKNFAADMIEAIQSTHGRINLNNTLSQTRALQEGITGPNWIASERPKSLQDLRVSVYGKNATFGPMIGHLNAIIEGTDYRGNISKAKMKQVRQFIYDSLTEGPKGTSGIEFARLGGEADPIFRQAVSAIDGHRNMENVLLTTATKASGEALQSVTESLEKSRKEIDEALAKGEDAYDAIADAQLKRSQDDINELMKMPDLETKTKDMYLLKVSETEMKKGRVLETVREWAHKCLLGIAIPQ